MSQRSIVAAGITFAIIAALAISFFMFTVRVPEGKVAVVYSPSGGAKEVLSPGWHLIGFFDDTQEYPTRITIVETKVAVTTSDSKKITIPTRYEMKVDKSKVLEIFRELGSQDVEEIQEGYLYQRLFKASRDTISQYSVLDIFGDKSSEASAVVTEKMRAASADLGFIITDVTFGNPDLDEETQKAIDARVKAAQELEKLKLDKQIAKENAEKQKIEAEGNAAVRLTNAKSEADANKLLQQSITDELIRMKEAEARLKHGWVTVQSGGEVIVDSDK